MTGPGRFVISLDFELLWGVRDHADRDAYGANILGAREAIPRLLDAFSEAEISATWATVGFLFCESKEELMASLPEERPRYSNSALSNYAYLNEVGENEAKDPYYFAPSLIDRIHQAPGQKIGTHTLSHFYCLEDGATVGAFEADLRAAKALTERRNIALESIVFPRNQFGYAHLDVCQRHGIAIYRGNPTSWAYRPAKGADQTPLRRAMRLMDAHSGILGPQTSPVPARGELMNVPASMFLRPKAGQLARFHGAHQRAIKRGMTSAATTGSVFHLWWHPHNFGRALPDNLDALKNVLAHFRALKETHGMQSASMETL